MQSPFYNSLLSDLPMTIHDKYPNSVVKMLGWSRNSLNDIMVMPISGSVCARVITALNSSFVICLTTSIMKCCFAIAP